VPVCPALPVRACARSCCRRPRRYPSDTTDAEWALIAPLLPVPACQARSGGRPEQHRRRVVVDAIRYVIHNGCVWRALPTDFPPWRTIYGLYQRWNARGATIALHDALRAAVRLAAGRTVEPTAAVIDSQSVRAAPTVPRSSRGWDNAKKVNGRKRHLAVDTSGLLLEVLATPASVQDRDAARPLLFNLHRARRRVRLAWADGGYAGRLLPWAATWLKLTVQIVKRPDDLHLPGPAAPVGRGADPGLDHQLPPLRPRLRTPPRQPRSHHLLGHDHPYDPPPRPPRLRFRNKHSA